MTDTPRKLGFIMPAEWQRHSAVWLAWPHDKISFGSLNEPEGTTNKERLAKVEKTLVEIILALHKTEPVELLVLDDLMLHRTSTLMQEAGVDITKITFHITDYADIWLRDYGPVFITNPQTHEQAWIKWSYNVYGSKFKDLLKDNEVFFNLRSKIDKRMFEPGVVMEGGSFEVNGQGTLITTEQCLLNSGRNPGMNKTQIEQSLKDYLGVKQIIWLKNGITNDHTDGHVDDVAKFVSPNKVVVAFEDDEQDENFVTLNESYNILKNSMDQDGKPLEVIKLPMPHMKYNDGQIAPMSYANFYIANKTVLVPTYKDPNDAKALEIIQTCFQGRTIIGIDCTELIYGGGAIHCMTQQQPLM